MLPKYYHPFKFPKIFGRPCKSEPHLCRCLHFWGGCNSGKSNLNLVQVAIIGCSYTEERWMTTNVKINVRATRNTMTVKNKLKKRKIEFHWKGAIFQLKICSNNVGIQFTNWNETQVSCFYNLRRRNLPKTDFGLWWFREELYIYL